ncbi:MAG: hypothetical protein L6N96_06085, partial [Candidatus Methylarchaceae archaeon HK02M2]|nr:hypothetical protein [Candidatus Methylarchaceae archaeon HK02M2]
MDLIKYRQIMDSLSELSEVNRRAIVDYESHLTEMRSKLGTKRSYVVFLRHFAEFLGEKPFQAVTEKDIKSFLRA